jgi:Domain of unknown function (DUF3883)
MPVPIERLMRMSAITPLVELRRYLAKNHGVKAEAAAAALREIDETFLASDHEAALELHTLLSPKLLSHDFVADLRIALSTVVTTIRPQWAKRVFLGRARFLTEMDRIDREVRQCFRTAGLLEDEPDKDVVLWWDLLCHEIRGIQNFDNFMQGRLAEQKSFQYEKERLRRLGISAEPKWQAIDDNTLGYDILSFREGGEFPARLLIEVKSSSRNPPAVIISRNEWIKANQAGDSYLFHFWDIRADVLYECGVDVVAPHMPNDQGMGEWANVSVPIGAVRRSPL